jgi:hypothetical protein
MITPLYVRSLLTANNLSVGTGDVDADLYIDPYECDLAPEQRQALDSSDGSHILSAWNMLVPYVTVSVHAGRKLHLLDRVTEVLQASGLIVEPDPQAVGLTILVSKKEPT